MFQCRCVNPLHNHIGPADCPEAVSGRCIRKPVACGRAHRASLVLLLLALWPAGKLFAQTGTPLVALSNAANTTLIPTIYFRTRFTFAGDAACSILCLQTIVNDGAVFYLDGVEKVRSRVCAMTRRGEAGMIGAARPGGLL